MATNFRTLNDFSVEELKNLISDLQIGVRYNDLKIKYSIPGFAFTPNTIAECKALIAQKTPKASITIQPVEIEDDFKSNYINRPDMPWTWTEEYREAHSTPEGYARRKARMQDWLENGF